MSRAAALVAVSGVTATGKSTVGRELARRLEVAYADADDFHPPGNIAKMRGGQPLTEAARQPWLAAIGDWLRERAGVGAVTSCSALRRGHRDQLRAAAPGVVFLQLTGSEAVLRSRLRQRDDHFMPESLLGSQLDAFEPLAADESGMQVDSDRTAEAIITDFVHWLHSRDDYAGGPQV